MNRRRQITGWLSTLIVGTGLIGLGVYFGRIGLDQSDKFSSVTGGLSGLAGLVLVAYGIVLAPPRAPVLDLLPISRGRSTRIFDDSPVPGIPMA